MIFNNSGLKDKVVLITGGSRGIGRAAVELLAKEANVAFFYKQNDELAKAIELDTASQGLTAVGYKIDVSDKSLCNQTVESIIERFGTIDILVNSAGIVRDNLLVAFEDEDIHDVYHTNVMGTFNVSRAVIPYMMAQKSGKIINISSVGATKGGRGQTNYAASKAAIEGFTKSLAVELAPKKILVNAIAPGVVKTDMTKDVRDLAGDKVLSEILLKRFANPDEIAHAIGFLASDYANYINGTVLHVDGGFKMG